MEDQARTKRIGGQDCTNCQQSRVNTAAFIRMVEKEIAQLLKQHSREQNKLRQQNEALRRENQALKEGNCTYRQEPISTAPSYLAQNLRGVLNCLSRQPTLALSKPKQVQTLQCSLPVSMRVSTLEAVSQKDSEEGLQQSQASELQVIRDRFNRDRGAKKRDFCHLQDRDSLSEALRQIRNRAQTVPSEPLQSSSPIPSNILNPGTYCFLKGRA